MPARKPESIAGLLALSPRGPSTFEGRASVEAFGGRVYGGLLIAQAVSAAGNTVASKRAFHSCHAYFLRPAAAAVPACFTVERVKDGAAFSLRRVVARQGDVAVLEMTASYHRAEKGWERAQAAPDSVLPEALPQHRDEAFARLGDVSAAMGSPSDFVRPLELRVERQGIGEDGLAERRLWFRLAPGADMDARLAEAALVYCSDFTLLGTAIFPHRSDPIGFDGSVSLDHSLWLHAPFPIGEWCQYALDSPWAGNGRALARGHVFSRDGRMIATVVQEGLLRQAVPRGEN